MNIYIAKQKQTHRHRKQISGYQWGEGKGNIGGGDEEVQTVTYKISYKDTTWEYSQYFITTINGV